MIAQGDKKYTCQKVFAHNLMKEACLGIKNDFYNLQDLRKCMILII